LTQLRDKFRNEKKAKKKRMLQNLDRVHEVSIEDIKVDEDEELQDEWFDESNNSKTPERFSSPSPLHPPNDGFAIAAPGSRINDAREEGIRLDNKYKQLMIEKIQLEKKFLIEKSQLEKIKLELEIQKLRKEI
jgi:hypothetical protein